MLSKGFGDVGGAKGGSTGTTTGSQFLEQYKTAQALAQLAAQHSQVAPPNASPSSWDTGASSLGQYGETGGGGRDAPRRQAASLDYLGHLKEMKRSPIRAPGVSVIGRFQAVFFFLYSCMKAR